MEIPPKKIRRPTPNKDDVTLLAWGLFFFLAQPTAALKCLTLHFVTSPSGPPHPASKNRLDQSEASLCEQTALIGLRVMPPYQKTPQSQTISERHPLKKKKKCTQVVQPVQTGYSANLPSSGPAPIPMAHPPYPLTGSIGG